MLIKNSICLSQTHLHASILLLVICHLRNLYEIELLMENRLLNLFEWQQLNGKQITNKNKKKKSLKYTTNIINILLLSIKIKCRIVG